MKRYELTEIVIKSIGTLGLLVGIYMASSPFASKLLNYNGESQMTKEEKTKINYGLGIMLSSGWGTLGMLEAYRRLKR